NDEVEQEVSDCEPERSRVINDPSQTGIRPTNGLLMGKTLRNESSMPHVRPVQTECMRENCDETRDMATRPVQTERDERDGQRDEMDGPRDPNVDKIREILIKQIDYGYLVKVGCQSLAIETSEKLLLGLKKYLDNPITTENKYFNKK